MAAHYVNIQGFPPSMITLKSIPTPTLVGQADDPGVGILGIATCIFLVIATIFFLLDRAGKDGLTSASPPLASEPPLPSSPEIHSVLSLSASKSTSTCSPISALPSFHSEFIYLWLSTSTSIQPHHFLCDLVSLRSRFRLFLSLAG